MAKAYEQFKEEELILRDHLALDRTVLANERTFLSYIRTMLAVVVVGATLVHLATDNSLRSIGVIIIMIGIAILIVGIKRTITMTEKIYGKSRKKN